MSPIYNAIRVVFFCGGQSASFLFNCDSNQKASFPIADVVATFDRNSLLLHNKKRDMGSGQEDGESMRLLLIESVKLKHNLQCASWGSLTQNLLWNSSLASQSNRVANSASLYNSVDLTSHTHFKFQAQSVFCFVLFLLLFHLWKQTDWQISIYLNCCIKQAFCITTMAHSFCLPHFFFHQLHLTITVFFIFIFVVVLFFCVSFSDTFSPAKAAIVLKPKQKSPLLCLHSSSLSFCGLTSHALKSSSGVRPSRLLRSQTKR